MISEVCRHCRNYFAYAYQEGDFSVKNGTIDLPFLYDGQYFLVEGSVFNDGVHQYPPYDLKDEDFKGTITCMAVPTDFVNLCNEIEQWQKKNGAVESNNMSPYQSESFNGYSYSKGAGSSDGATVSWKNAFRSRLNEWRKL